jgi:hypothetical protein
MGEEAFDGANEEKKARLSLYKTKIGADRL